MKKMVKLLVLCSIVLNSALFAVASQDIKNIDSNTTLDDSISKSGEFKLYKFTLKEKSEITTYTTGTTDTYGSILNSNQEEIIANDDSGENTNFKIIKTLEAGDYFIKVRGFTKWDMGEYKLSFNIEKLEGDKIGDSIKTAYSFKLNSDVNATVNDKTDIDIYKIEIKEEGKLKFYTDGSTDTYCYLLNEDGNILSQDDDSGYWINCQIEATVAKGTYYLKVRGYGPWIKGDYKITNEFEAFDNKDDYGNTFSEATDINSTQLIEGKINYSGDKDVFSFNLDKQKIVSICGLNSFKNIEIYNSDYEKIDTNETFIYKTGSLQDDLTRNNCDDQNGSYTALSQVLANGKYYIVASSDKEEEYKIKLITSEISYIGDTIKDAKQIPLDVTYSAAIEVYSDIDIFKFDINQTEEIRVVSTGKQKFTLLDSNGNEITTYDDIKYIKDNNLDTHPHIIKTLEPGTYYIKFKAMDNLFFYNLTCFRDNFMPKDYEK